MAKLLFPNSPSVPTRGKSHSRLFTHSLRLDPTRGKSHSGLFSHSLRLDYWLLLRRFRLEGKLRLQSVPDVGGERHGRGLYIGLQLLGIEAANGIAVNTFLLQAELDREL